jgi:hypothetical protein
MHYEILYTVTAYDITELMGIELGTGLTYRQAVKLARDTEHENDKPGNGDLPIVDIEIDQYISHSIIPS